MRLNLNIQLGCNKSSKYEISQILGRGEISERFPSCFLPQCLLFPDFPFQQGTLVPFDTGLLLVSAASYSLGSWLELEFCFLSLFFLATLTAYGSSQARDWLPATAATCCNLCCNCPQQWILKPTVSSWDQTQAAAIRFLTHCTSVGTPEFFFLFIMFIFFHYSWFTVFCQFSTT